MFSAFLTVIVLSSLIILVRLFVALWSRGSETEKASSRDDKTTVADAPSTEPSIIDRLAGWIEEPYVDPHSWPDEEWSSESPVCPCCHCIAQSGSKSCFVCDWEEPLGEDVEAGNRDALLAEARARYDATGSAITVEERASWGGLLTPREQQLRSEIRERCDYLRAGDRPDTSEVHEEIDRLLGQLQNEAKRKHVDAGE